MLKYIPEQGGLDMYNIVIGVSSYSEMIIDLLREKNKFIIAIDKKQNLEKINNKKIVKLEVNIENAKLVQHAVEGRQIESIYVVTDNDKLNLMLGEALANYENTNVLFLDERLAELADGGYKVICPSLLVKEFIQKEMN